MKVTIFGSGYVGLVTGACLADAGNHVVCVDIDAAKVARLNAGEVPIHEPGLDALIKRNRESGRLEFTTDAARGVDHGLFQLIAVGTPPDEDGSADLSHVVAVARTIGTHLSRYAIVITKSTVPVGTADRVRQEVAGTLAARGANVEFDSHRARSSEARPSDRVADRWSPVRLDLPWRPESDPQTAGISHSGSMWRAVEFRSPGAVSRQSIPVRVSGAATYSDRAISFRSWCFDRLEFRFGDLSLSGRGPR